MEGFIKRYPDVTLSKKYPTSIFDTFAILLSSSPWVGCPPRTITVPSGERWPGIFPDTIPSGCTVEMMTFTFFLLQKEITEHSWRRGMLPWKEENGLRGGPEETSLVPWETLGGNWESSWETTLATGGRHTTCQRHTSYQIESRFHKPANFTITYQIHFKVWGGQIFILAHIQF